MFRGKVSASYIKLRLSEKGLISTLNYILYYTGTKKTKILKKGPISTVYTVELHTYIQITLSFSKKDPIFTVNKT